MWVLDQQLPTLYNQREMNSEVILLKFVSYVKTRNLERISFNKLSNGISNWKCMEFVVKYNNLYLDQRHLSLTIWKDQVLWIQQFP